MKFDPLNLYKLHLNTVRNVNLVNNRYQFKLPNYFPQNKKCFVFVEYACLQVTTSAGTIANDYFNISSNLISQNSYNNNNENMSGVLCSLGKTRNNGRAAATEYIELDIQTNPINVGYLPNQLELFIIDPVENAEITLPSSTELVITICCQFVDHDNGCGC